MALKMLRKAKEDEEVSIVDIFQLILDTVEEEDFVLSKTYTVASVGYIFL